MLDGGKKNKIGLAWTVSVTACREKEQNWISMDCKCNRIHID